MSKTKKGDTAKAPAKSKRERFLSVCGLRMQKALKAIELVGNCASSNYEYTEADVKKINAALGSTCQAVLNRFRPRDNEEADRPSFKFD